MVRGCGGMSQQKWTFVVSIGDAVTFQIVETAASSDTAYDRAVRRVFERIGRLGRDVMLIGEVSIKLERQIEDAA